MGITYEWHAATGSQAWIVDSDELRDMAEDYSDITSTTLGVGFDDGGGGGIIYGEPDDLVRYHADIVGRLVQRIANGVETGRAARQDGLRVDPAVFLTLSTDAVPASRSTGTDIAGVWPGWGRVVRTSFVVQGRTCRRSAWNRRSSAASDCDEEMKTRKVSTLIPARANALAEAENPEAAHRLRDLKCLTT